MLPFRLLVMVAEAGGSDVLFVCHRSRFFDNIFCMLSEFQASSDS